MFAVRQRRKPSRPHVRCTTRSSHDCDINCAITKYLFTTSTVVNKYLVIAQLMSSCGDLVVQRTCGRRLYDLLTNRQMLP